MTIDRDIRHPLVVMALDHCITPMCQLGSFGVISKVEWSRNDGTKFIVDFENLTVNGAAIDFHGMRNAIFIEMGLTDERLLR